MHINKQTWAFIGLYAHLKTRGEVDKEKTMGKEQDREGRGQVDEGMIGRILLLLFSGPVTLICKSQERAGMH